MKGGPDVKLIAGLLFLLSFVAAASGAGSPAASTIDGPVDGMAFVLIPEGSFTIGSPESDPWAGPDEKPQRTVEVEAFQMMTTEVTQAMWEAVTGENPSHFTGDGSRPVEMVSWDDCQEFIDALNSMGDGYVYRLPAEAEWEYACRAGTTARFYWGEIDSRWIVGRYCWFGDNSEETTHPVGLKLPNPWGLYDMIGNVAEWCQDWSHDGYEGLPDDGSAWVAGGGEYRRIRGSWWTGTIPSLRSAFRGDYAPGHRLNYVGLRLVRTPE
jgi:formylglycine-generating enzyme required for sulfatase activity